MKEDNDVQEASNDNHIFLIVDDNAGGSAGGSASEEKAESPKTTEVWLSSIF